MGRSDFRRRERKEKGNGCETGNNVHIYRECVYTYIPPLSPLRTCALEAFPVDEFYVFFSRAFRWIYE